MKAVETFAAARQLGLSPVGLVPTLGGLHEGHLSLMQRAREENETLMVSVFVNPLQFGPGEDLDTYPGDLEHDAEFARRAGADVLFTPGVAEVYPTTPVMSISLGEGPLTQSWEAATRPHHFGGVAIVVAKLFAGLRPDRAYFGQKDAQQLAIVRRLVVDLSFPTEIAALPTVRAADGVALSTRNQYLDAAERDRARSISSGLFAAADAAEAGERSGAELIGIAREMMDAAVDIDYVAMVDEVSFAEVEVLRTSAVLIAAAKVGPARLIDNVPLRMVGEQAVAERGVRLAEPSVLEER